MNVVRINLHIVCLEITNIVPNTSINYNILLNIYLRLKVSPSSLILFSNILILLLAIVLYYNKRYLLLDLTCISFMSLSILVIIKSWTSRVWSIEDISSFVSLISLSFVSFAFFIKSQTFSIVLLKHYENLFYFGDFSFWFIRDIRKAIGPSSAFY